MNEYEIIDCIVKASGKLPRSYSKIGDDVAEIPPSAGKLVIKSDMLVAKTDVPLGMTLREAARKSVAMCVSDFASKGVVPDSFLVSLGVWRGITRRQVQGLARGFADASKEWGVRLVGGDTSEADGLIIDCTMLGFSGEVVRRSGARSGQVVVTTGYFGYAAAGLKILLEGASAESEFRRLATASVLRPSPNLAVGLGMARFLTSAMDSSDGLAICLHTLAKSSGVGFRVTSLPMTEDLKSFARSNDYSAEELALYGGEEYLIVGTIEGRNYRAAKRLAKSLGGDLIAIGETTTGPGEEEGVVLDVEGVRRPIEMRGWIHLA